jgi:hypothetical protein
MRELKGVDPARFRAETMAAYEPVVLRGAVRDWPLVQKGLASPEAAAGYLQGFDRGRPVETFVGPAAIAGRIFYDPSLSGFNFERRAQPLPVTLAKLLEHLDDPSPPAVYVGAIDLRGNLPEVAAENRLDLVAPEVPPRIWIGNAIEISAHFDVSHNIACVAAGRRRFTLFPPDEVANLYIGPLEFTVAGQPISLVSIEAPDLKAHPRFEKAQARALTAELEPGDAVYIPPLWWHHVRALTPFNVLVNYWWEEAPLGAGSPFDCLVHGLLAIRHLPEPEREAWRALFDHYIFEKGGPAAAHLPEGRRGILGPLTPAMAQQIRAFLMRGLSRTA